MKVVELPSHPHSQHSHMYETIADVIESGAIMLSWLGNLQFKGTGGGLFIFQRL